MSENIYIHYGSDKFDKERFMPIVNREMFTKPVGGLWATPENARFGWKEWCLQENYETQRLQENFEFTLGKYANILTLRNLDDLVGLPHQQEIHGLYTPASSVMGIILDFEKMLEDGIDAINLDLSGGGFELFRPLYMWDCDSILIMNPDIIKPL